MKKDFSHIKPGQWIKYIGYPIIDFVKRNKWYHIISAENDYKLWFHHDKGRPAYTVIPTAWDLEDIRDENPELKTGCLDSIVESSCNKERVMQEEFEEITKDNIAEVLEYNGIDKDRYFCYAPPYSCIQIVYSKKSQFDYERYDINNPKWLAHVEVELGKLKPLPKKPAEPKDLMGWWNINKFEGFSLSTYEMSNYYELAYRDNHCSSYIYKSWSLERQINVVKKLIEIYKD